MSRFAFKEPLVTVQRHISNSPPRPTSNSPPRRNLHQSKILAALDAEMERMKLQETNVKVPHGGSSNAMKMALDTSGTGGIGSLNHEVVVSGKPVHPFFLKPSSAPIGRPVSSKNTALGSSRTNVQTAIDHATPTLEDPKPIHAPEEPPPYPLYSYKTFSPKPTRFYVRDETEANELVSKLKGPLGFDLEWRVIFGRKAPERKTAILQLCDDQTILIIQLTAMKHFPQKVKEIVESQDIIKMGVNILGDGRKLRRDYRLAPAGLLELSHLARLADPIRVTSKRMISLQRIVEMYTGYTLSKGAVRTSNWEARLSEDQLDYAANDAHSALKVYTELMRLARDAGLVLIPVEMPANPSTTGMGITFLVESPKTPDGHLPDAATADSGSRRAISSKYNPKPQDKSKPSASTRIGAVHVTSPQDLLHASKSDSMKGKRPVGGQLLRAYKLWHEEHLSLPQMCSALRSPEHPLAKSTVITYVVEAVKADASLPFSRIRLKELAKLESGSWQRHGWWIDSLDKTDRGLATW